VPGCGAAASGKIIEQRLPGGECDLHAFGRQALFHWKSGTNIANQAQGGSVLFRFHAKFEQGSRGRAGIEDVLPEPERLGGSDGKWQHGKTPRRREE